MNPLDLITDHLDIWTTAQVQEIKGRGKSTKNKSIYGVKRLRELILDLAVRGKLVPQDSNDEHASVLLEKITAEKVRLVKTRKIKESKPLPAIIDNEVPFDLPEGWKWTKMGDLSTNIHYGFTASANHQLKNVRLLRITDIQNNEVNWDTVPGCEIDENKTSDYQLENGDILIARTGGTIGKSYLVSNLNLSAIFASYLIRVRRIEGVEPEFIKVYLGSLLYWNQLYESSMGTGQPNVNGNALKNLLVAFPPLAEQHRIVAKVNELMTLCDQLEQQQTNSNATHQTLVETLLAALTHPTTRADGAETNTIEIFFQHFDTLFTTEQSIDQLKQTILQLAVMGKLVPQDPSEEAANTLLQNIAKEKAYLVGTGKIKKQKTLPEIKKDEKPIELPKAWKVERLGVFSIVGTGSTPARDNEAYYSPPEINWVTSGETSSEFITETKEKISKLAVKETNVSVYPVGTLIVAMYGQGKTRGQVTELMIEAGTNQACAAIVLVENSETHRKYIKLFFEKAYEELRSHAAGGAQPNLNVGKISKTVIPIPPLAEQQRIVAKIEELMTLCNALKSRLTDAHTTQLQLADAIVEQAVI